MDYLDKLMAVCEGMSVPELTLVLLFAEFLAKEQARISPSSDEDVATP